ncbi:hypothetical protein FIBSPDRAFT_985913 [Athelia psychrophila]|uniref:Uncharacterized protein n=1 Tax=Athelia psychrophila TaxID=1759441 RepID=A0A166B193_9AGAM|nr:hypothetical protein FIBSPDRAFT_985913 [Fibularhizoctonia sp. CBS 109695]
MICLVGPLSFVGPDVKAGLESLSVLLLSILSTAFEQPMFSANFLAFDIKPLLPKVVCLMGRRPRSD